MPIEVLCTMAAGRVFAIRDNFMDPHAAGALDGTLAIPGPGTRSVVDTGNLLSVASSVLHAAAGGSTTDPCISWDAQDRAEGLTMFLKTRRELKANYFHFGWKRVPDSSPNRMSFVFGGTNVFFYDNVLVNHLGPIETVDVWENYAIVLRSTGCFGLKKIDNYWTLLWVARTNSDDPLVPSIAPSNPSGWAEADNLHVAQLKGVWAADYGIATDRLPGARNVGDTFVHEPDHLIRYTITSLPTNPADTMELVFREQDANNHWYLEFNGAGDIKLFERVGGVATQRGSTASGVLSGGERMTSIDVGPVLKGFADNTLLGTYSNAINFQQATQGRVAKLDPGGSISDIVAYPRQLLGAEGRTLEKYSW